MKKKVFLGGTCNNSQWRETLIPLLEIDYFNPVVEDWTPDCQAIEIRERETCDYCLYTITPKMMGVYSIAEVVDDSNKRPEKTILVILEEDGDDAFTLTQIKSLKATADLVTKNGGQVFNSLEDAARGCSLSECQHEWKIEQAFECSNRICVKCDKYEPAYDYY